MTSKTLFALIVLTMAACAGAGQQAGTPERDVPDVRRPPPTDPVVASALVRTSAVPRGTVQGVVLDELLGTPVEGAQVTIEGTGMGVLSGANGLFRLPGFTGRHRLKVAVIGYRDFVADLSFDAPSGVAARVALTPVKVCIACVIVGTLPSVGVVVRDALTGGAPQSELRLEIHEGSYSAEARAPPSAGEGFVHLSVGPWRPGRYRVSLTAPGYSRWQRQSVVVGEDGCGCAASTYLSVLLLPEGQPLDPAAIHD